MSILPVEMGLSWRDLFSPQEWIRPRFALLIGTLAASLTAWISSNCTQRWYWIFTFTGLAVVITFITWFLVRMLYWRTGRGDRVGVLFEGIKVPAEELAFAQSAFAGLARDEPSHTRISLKVVPRHLFHSEQRQRSFVERHKLAGLLTLEVSEIGSVNRFPAFSVHLRSEHEVNNALIASSAHPLLQIASLAAPKASELNMLRNQVSSLYNILLFLLATRAINDNRLATAVLLLRRLDSRLSDRLPDRSSQPRFAVRHMIYTLTTNPVLAHPDLTDNPAIAAQAADKILLIAKEFGDEFPQYRVTLARIYFLADNIEQAKIVSREISGGPNGPFHAHYELNEAFFALYDGAYAESARRFDGMLVRNDFKLFNMIDLVGFADHCRNKGHDFAVVLQVLYRRLLGHAVDALQIDLTVWAGQSVDRRKLQGIAWSAKSISPPPPAPAPGSVSKTPKGKNKWKRR